MAEAEETSIIQTKCSAYHKSAVDSFEVVVHNHKRKQVDRKIKDDKSEPVKIPPIQKKEMDMKKARYEVFKLAMAGLKADQKQEAKAALAIQLGAKPPKNKGYNYKEYKELKQKQKMEQLQQQKLLSLGKTKKKKPPLKGNKVMRHGGIKTKKDGILDIYGKPGKVNIIIVIIIKYAAY